MFQLSPLTQHFQRRPISQPLWPTVCSYPSLLIISFPPQSTHKSKKSISPGKDSFPASLSPIGIRQSPPEWAWPAYQAARRHSNFSSQNQFSASDNLTPDSFLPIANCSSHGGRSIFVFCQLIRWILKNLLRWLQMIVSQLLLFISRQFEVFSTFRRQ